LLREIHQNELHHIDNDPVRPHIDVDWRRQTGRTVYVLENDDTKEIDAVICTAMTDNVPTCEEDMQTPGVKVAVFYTVWSYSKGAGRKIVFEAANEIKRKNSTIKRFVTLSPNTTMAERFHLANGAEFLAKYKDCQNFEYHL
jgi:hypothetical protein